VADVAQVFDRNRVVDFVVRLEDDERRDPDRVGELRLRNAAGEAVLLREVADVYARSGRPAIFHDGTRRYQEVACNVAGRDLASFLAEARARLAKEVALPPEVTLSFQGAAFEQGEARREILLHAGLAGAGILLLLGVAFRSGRALLLVLANVPFALVGGVAALFLLGGHLSVGTLVGFVTLFGITMRNSIMMVSHFEHLVAVDGLPWTVETALRGASERLVPVLMTALVTALGLLPIALGTGEPGKEIEGPMAIVILGGLATSTALNLLVLPALALRFGRFGASADEES
jgi:Cu/Ag efflux pump CusA